jgi:hypothetical protein
MQTPPVHQFLYHHLRHLYIKSERSNAELCPSLEGRIEDRSLPQWSLSQIRRYDRTVDMILVGQALDAMNGDAEHTRYVLCDVFVVL